MIKKGNVNFPSQDFLFRQAQNLLSSIYVLIEYHILSVLVNVWDNHLAHFLLSSAQNLLTSSAKSPKFSAFSPEKTSENPVNTHNSASFK